jgi:hypothetical protein
MVMGTPARPRTRNTSRALRVVQMHFELWFLVDLTSELLRFGLLVIANFPIIGANVLFLM